MHGSKYFSNNFEWKKCRFCQINYGSSRHFDNLKNNFLVLGDGLTDVISNSVNEPECLNLHHNTEER